MTMTDAAAVPRRRFGLLLWVAGILGVVVITATALPQLLGQVTLPAPLAVILLAKSRAERLSSRTRRLVWVLRSRQQSASAHPRSRLP